MDNKSKDLVTQAICYGYFLAHHHQLARERQREDHLYAIQAARQSWPTWQYYADRFLDTVQEEADPRSPQN
ncbi:MAG TPA: hypothetical protein P5186_12355 [Candidatus Paceibacterota bacterium]|nr:hypothetical protein [Verrucomicrobiota bacterium]HRY48833.1 hypothetical protein [Candidatus Paceibacterota bacterium]